MSRQYDNRGRDQYNVENIWGNAYFQGPGQRLRDEQILLTAVKNEVDSRLYQSLHNAVFLNLEREARSNQVNRPWDKEIKLRANAAIAVPADMTFTQIFDSPDINGKLLILGQPGAGKTTALLDLAKALVEKAEENLSFPIPVLLNLSSWRNEKQLIRDWVLVELKSKYGVSSKLGQKWIAERVLLPLLDGLDEVAPERQERCVQQLNTFLAGESSPLYAVVCSRVADYEHYETSLQLNGAIYLKELSDQQIQEYLTTVKRDELWQFLAQRAELLEMVRAPLLLSMAVIAYPQGSIEQWQFLQTSNDQLQYLLNAYVQQMLQRTFDSRAFGRKIPSEEQTRLWLSWLARQMEKTSQTEFLIEEMQPSMLPDKARRKYRLIGGLLVGLLAGLGSGLNSGLSNGLFGGLLGVPLGYLLWEGNALLTLMHSGVASRFASGQMSTETYLQSFMQTQNLLNPSLSSGLIVGLVVGLIIGLIFWSSSGLSSELSVGLIGGPVGVILLWLFLRLRGRLSSQIKSVEVLRFSWAKFIKKGLINGLLWGLLAGGLTGGLIGLLGGGLIGLLLGALLGALLGGLFVGLFVGPVSGLLRGMSQGSLDVKTIPNQGIKRSAINYIFVVLMSGLLLGLLGGLFELSDGPISALTSILKSALTDGLTFGLFLGLFLGGVTCIQHFTLRLLLYKFKFIPWNYARFMNYSTELLFLQRVGGRYRFMHKLLQEHFARMPLDSSGQ